MATDAAYKRLALRIFADFSGTIAIPAVLGALFGKWLDGRYGTHPRYLILVLALALVLTAIVIVKRARGYAKAYEGLNKKDNKKILHPSDKTDAFYDDSNSGS